MTLGIFAKTFPRPTLSETLDAVAAHGIRCVQFNFACCGLPTMPDRIDPELLANIQAELTTRQLAVAAISATFNLIHPDPSHRLTGLQRLPGLARAAQALGAPMLTLCTGTRDPGDMWRAHPENRSPEAWQALCGSLELALKLTETTGIEFGIEPELANVVDSAHSCRKLLDDLKSPRLRVVLDGANLLQANDLPRQTDIFAEAFDLLGPDVSMAHAKELDAQGNPSGLAPGSGAICWDAFFAGLHRIQFQGPVVLHGLAENTVPSAMEFLLNKLQSATPGA
jgi:sugar phosphate isomerase/epimerase